MKRTLGLVLTLIAVLTVTELAWGQVPTGIPPHGSFSGGPFDIVNTGNLNVHFVIPVLQKAGRGVPFVYDLVYDSSVWYPVTSGSTKVWTPVTSWGWGQGLGPVFSPYMSYSVVYSSANCYNGGTVTYYRWDFSNFVYYDTRGVSHWFGVGGTYFQSPGGNSCPPNGQLPATIPTTYANDGSGLSLSNVSLGPGTPSGTLTTADGSSIGAPWLTSPPTSTSPFTTTDRNGNQITETNAVYTDTLGTTVLTATGTAPSSTLLTYTSPSGPVSYTASYHTYTVTTSFGCFGITEYSKPNQYLVDRVTLPDGTFYQFNYEQTGQDSQIVTGRLASVQLPTGGTIAYAYSNGTGTGNNAINCTDGTAMTLTRTPNPGGAWIYARTQVSGAHWQTTTTDPSTAQNQTVIDFWQDSGSNGTMNFYETQRLMYQGSSVQGGGGTLLSTTITCYNNTNPTPSSCPTTTVSTPVNNKTVFSYLPDASGQQAKTFVSYYQGVAAFPSEIDSYNFGTGSVGILARKTVTTYSIFGTGAILPTSAVMKDGSNNVVASTTFTHDQGSVTITGAKQHVSVSGARGNVTAVATQVNSTQTLYRNFDYYDTGMVKDSYDYSLSATSSGPKTSFTYDNTGTPPRACEYAFPTSITLPNSLSTSATWDCTGGVQTSATDENGQVASVAFKDPNPNTTSWYWRPATATDQLSYVTGIAYSGATIATLSLPFNGTSSVAELRAQVDGLGRPLLSQRRQGPGSTSYDTVETDYTNFGPVAKVTLPFSAAAGGTSSTAPGTSSSYDALGRTIAVSDSGGGSVTYIYNQNDVRQTIGPAPTGEIAKVRQLEYDALGRLTSVCEVTSVTGSGNCAQNSAQTGFWTKYTYDLMGDLTGVTQNAQAATNSQQTRTYTYDMMSRILTESNPETGNTTYVYDTDSACGTTPYPGNRVKRVDASGNVTCYAYDNLQRLLGISYLPGGPNTANTPKKTFVYGTATTTTINSKVLNKTANRMVEAYTCFGSCTLKSTDLLFNYSPRGEIADVYESTPNSGTGYYDAKSQYWANGALNMLSLLNSSGAALIPAITYGADGEGRTSAITAASGTNPVYSTSYNTASQVTGVNYMVSGSDNDIFTFDPNTFRITDYQFNVGSPTKQDWGHLNWNQNGTLGSLAITDPLNTSNSQTCNYTYDDLGRLASKTPPTPNIVCGTKWSQTISLDAFGNISKAATVGTSFQATYVPASGPPTNRIVQIGSLAPTYDANGNLKYDATTSTTHQYTWDAEGKMITIDNGISSGVCLTYDALGRMVELGLGATCATHTQLVYSPGGSKLALLNGQTLQKAFVPLTGGATAVYNASGLQYFRHTDWLGSSRLATTPNRTMYYDTAYAPYGEDYVGATGTGGAKDLSFTGQNEDTTSWMYDFMFRQYSQTQGRWMSPDPAGLGAVALGNPQSWNRYVYVVNAPLTLLDPLGLTCHIIVFYVDGIVDSWEVNCDGGGGGGGTQGLGGTGGGGGGGGGGNGSAKNGTQTPWYENSCITSALGAGALSVGIDSIGLIPEAGGIARVIGHQAGYVGVVADQLGSRVVGAVGASTSTVNGLAGLGDTSPEGLLSTGLTVAGFIPGAGTVASGLSIGLDIFKTAKAIAKCH